MQDSRSTMTEARVAVVRSVTYYPRADVTVIEFRELFKDDLYVRFQSGLDSRLPKGWVKVSRAEAWFLEFFGRIFA